MEKATRDFTIFPDVSYLFHWRNKTMPDPFWNQSVAGDSLESAAQWVEQLLLGQLGMAIAVSAIAFVGFNMLLGHTSPKEMGRILLGCAILFGAPAIARGFLETAEAREAPASFETPVILSAPAETPPSAPNMPPATVNPFDPYVGASGR